MEKLDIVKTNKTEIFPEINITPVEEFASKTTPTFESPIIDGVTSENIGKITFKIKKEAKEILVEDVFISKSKQGYGVSLYRKLRDLYPDFQMVSSGQIEAKDNEEQEKPNAVYLWEKLVRLGDAEEDGRGGYKMKNK